MGWEGAECGELYSNFGGATYRQCRSIGGVGRLGGGLNALLRSGVSSLVGLLRLMFRVV